MGIASGLGSTLAAPVPAREIEGKVQLAYRIREQANNIAERTAQMRSRLLGAGEASGASQTKPEPERAELAELEHALVTVQDVLNTVQLHLNDLERI